VANKESITQRVLDQLGPAADLDLETALQRWWVNLRATGGLRLTDLGREVFSSIAGYESFEFETSADILTGRNLVALDRKMSEPYHLQKNRKTAVLTMFGSREAMMASLYGDIQRFIDNLET
jgi:hypothetical protein